MLKLTAFTKNQKPKLLKEAVIIVIAILIFIIALNSSFLTSLASKLDYQLFKLNNSEEALEIVIVDLDDNTLNDPDFKRFSDISRWDYARVIENILASNPKVLALDVFFYNQAEDQSHDQKLLELLTNNPNLIIASSFDFENQQFLLPLRADKLNLEQVGYINFVSQQKADHSAITHTPFIYSQTEPEKGEYEPLAVKAWRIISNQQQAEVQLTADYYQINELKIPLKKARAAINYLLKPEALKRVSFIDAYQGGFNPEAFKDKIVLVGASAQDLHDSFLTPLGVMPGVEIHANFLATLLADDFIDYQGKLGQIIILIILIACFWGLLQLRNFWLSLTLFIGELVIFLLAVIIAFKYLGLFIPFTLLVLTSITVYLILTSSQYLEEQKAKKRIQSAFARYVNPQIAKEICQNPEVLSLKGSEKKVTIFFSDLVDFTKLAEKLSPKELIKLLNTYLETMSEIIINNNGTIDKYIGDAIMAFWGAPIADKQQEANAVRAALEQLEELKSINQKLQQQGLPEVEIRIGIHTDKVIVGNIGGSRLDYTAIGEGVNLTSRLESLNKFYQTKIICSEKTAKKLPTNLKVRLLDQVQVKGSLKATKIYQITSNQKSEFDRLNNNYQQAFALFLNQKFKAAKETLEKLKNDQPSKILLQRIEKIESGEQSFNGGVRVFGFK